MKDLRFKIIADFVKGGFDRATSAVNSFKAKLAEIRGGGAQAWSMIAAGAATAGVVMYKVGERLRQSWLADMDRMRNAASQFTEDVNKNFRKIRFQDTESEKALNLEKIDNKIRAYRDKIAKLDDEMATKSIAGNVLDLGEKTVRKIAGHGFTESSEVELERAKKEMAILERQRIVAAGKETNDAKKAALEKAKAIQAIEKEWMEEEKGNRASRLSADKAAHESELAWAKEEAAAWKESMDAKVKAAMDAADKIAKIRELVEGVNDVRRELAYESASPEQRQNMDKAQLRKIQKQVMAKNALGDFILDPEERAEKIKEGLKLQAKIKAFKPTEEEREKKPDRDGRKKSLTSSLSLSGRNKQSNDDSDGTGFQHKGRDPDGGFKRKGGKWGRHRSFAAGRDMADGTSGPTANPVDEGLTVAKETLSTLKRIEQKTGSAP